MFHFERQFLSSVVIGGVLQLDKLLVLSVVKWPSFSIAEKDFSAAFDWAISPTTNHTKNVFDTVYGSYATFDISALFKQFLA